MTEKKDINWNTVIGWVSAGFVFCLTIVSLILTYNALFEVANDNGLTTTVFGVSLAYIWPLTIDGALIVFSLAVINASLSNNSPALRWAMVGVFTVLTIVFNFIDGGTDNLPGIVGKSMPFAVRVIPPLALVMSFETLMSMLRKSAQRDTVTKTINELSREVDMLIRKRNRLESEVDQLTVTKEENTMTPKEQRLAELPGLVSGGKTATQIADRFGVKERTVYRYLEEAGLSLSDNGNG